MVVLSNNICESITLKNINTLVIDIQHYIETTEDWFDLATDDYLQRFGREPYSTGNGLPRRGLRLSALGDRCPRALWYMVHHPEMAESLPASAKFKYGYGHIIEALALSLARLAGHTVEGEQDELVVDGIRGHRDAVVDGCVLDVKSCSSLSFHKFQNKTLADSDDFGYLYQLDGYVLGSIDDPIVTVKDKGYFLAIDKTLGHMVLYEHKYRPTLLQSRIETYKRIVENPEPPRCQCGTRIVGSSGNIGLDTRASYSQYKHLCFPELRTFLYRDGTGTKPVHLVKVVRTPDVPELFTMEPKLPTECRILMQSMH